MNNKDEIKELIKNHKFKIGDVIEIDVKVSYTKDRLVCIIDISDNNSYHVIDKYFSKFWINRVSIKKLIG